MCFSSEFAIRKDKKQFTDQVTQLSVLFSGLESQGNLLFFLVINYSNYANLIEKKFFKLNRNELDFLKNELKNIIISLVDKGQCVCVCVCMGYVTAVVPPLTARKRDTCRGRMKVKEFRILFPPLSLSLSLFLLF